MKIDSGSIRQFVSLCILIFTVLFLTSCATQKELISAKSDTASVRENLQGLETSVGKRQVVLSEELQEVKAHLNKMESRDEELRQAITQLRRKVNVQKIETDENFKQIASLNLQYQKSLDNNLRQLSDNLQDLEISLGDLNHRLDEINALESDQNRRIGETTSRLNIFLSSVHISMLFSIAA